MKAEPMTSRRRRALARKLIYEIPGKETYQSGKYQLTRKITTPRRTKAKKGEPMSITAPKAKGRGK